MALDLDKLTQQPLWKLALGWVLGALVIVAGWHTLYYSDAEAARDQEKQVLKKTSSERDEMERKLAGFEEEMEKAALAQQEIDAAMEVLPMSAASVDHMMRTFQQQGRLVGLHFDRWEPKPEVRTQYYAETPVSVSATGTWNQFGEFFRRISELKKIVSINEFKILVGGSRGQNTAGRSPVLGVSFVASTYRFLNDQERAKPAPNPRSRRRTRGKRR